MQPSANNFKHDKKSQLTDSLSATKVAKALE